MKTRQGDAPSARAGVSPTRIAIRHAHDVVEAEQLLPRSVLDRLWPRDRSTAACHRDLYGSHVIVAVVEDVAVGFAAYTSATGSVQVAHEFWVDRHTRVGVAPITEALLKRLEFLVRAAARSRLVVVLPESTPLRGIFEQSGYRVAHGGAGPSWFEKSVIDSGPPRESASVE